jgi:GT2 family glycosyltransferase
VRRSKVSRSRLVCIAPKLRVPGIHFDQRAALRMKTEERFSPRAILELELSDHSMRHKGDESVLLRERALVLVRIHSTPLGVLDLALGGADPERIFEMASKELGPVIGDHLARDSASTDASHTQCNTERSALLANAPLASVVLATKNRPELAARCLESILALDYPNFEVVVVDSSEESETKDLIEDRFREVNYVANSSGRVCVAKSRGASAAKGIYMAFTDDDAEVDQHWLSELVLALQSSTRVACATGLVLPLELETQAQLWFEESGAFVEGIRPRRISLATREPGSLLPYATGRIGAGVNMAWRTEVLTQLGFFDIALDKCGAEDLAAYFDALCAGYEIVYAPKAIVWHQHRRTVEELRRQTLWHATGLGAYLTRCLVKEPGRTWDLIRRVPGGLRYGFAARSIRNSKKTHSFPREVTRQEWIGFVKGPMAYVSGAIAARRARRRPSN